MATIKKLPQRSQVKSADTWDLSSLVADDKVWEREFTRFQKRTSGLSKFRGKLAQDAKTLATCLKYDLDLDRLGERLGTYAFLKTTEDQTDSTYQAMLGRFQNAAVNAAQLASFIRPEIMAISQTKMQRLMASRVLKPYRLLLEKLRRYKKHTLGEKEEGLLAMQGEMAQAASKTFRQLHDADLKFGFVKNEHGEQIELSNATLAQFLHSPKRSVRRTAFQQYYKQFSAHENTLAATLSGSIQKDVYYARARGYDGALHHALYPDNVPQTVYDNLIASVRNHLPTLHHLWKP